MSNEKMVYVKAIHGNILFGSSILMEGSHRMMAMSPTIERLEQTNMIKTFKTEKEAKDYKYLPMSHKATQSIDSFSQPPVRPKTSIEMSDEIKEELKKRYEEEKAAFEARKTEALVTPFGDPLPRALEIEAEANEPEQKDITPPRQPVAPDDGEPELKETTPPSQPVAPAPKKGKKK